MEKSKRCDKFSGTFSTILDKRISENEKKCNGQRAVTNNYQLIIWKANRFGKEMKWKRSGSDHHDTRHGFFMKWLTFLTKLIIYGKRLNVQKKPKVKNRDFKWFLTKLKSVKFDKRNSEWEWHVSFSLHKCWANIRNCSNLSELALRDKLTNVGST